MEQSDTPAKVASNDQLGHGAEAATLVERLRNTPNWLRESFEHWKTATSVYDRAPFEAADEIERLRAALLNCARQAEALKRVCYDPESSQAARNSQYQNISATAHIALGTIRGPTHEGVLSDDEVLKLWRANKYRGNGGQADWFAEGVRAAERAYGFVA